MALRDIWDDFKAGLRDTEIDPATGKEVPKKQNPYMNMIMGQSQGGAPGAGGAPGIPGGPGCCTGGWLPPNQP